MDLARDAGLSVEERRIKPEEIAKAQEVFVTGTATEIPHQLGKIDDLVFEVGPRHAGFNGGVRAAVGV